MLIANSLINGFLGSNFTGQVLVMIQICFSIVMVAAIFGKWKSLSSVLVATRRFVSDFSASHETLEYYVQRRPKAANGLERIYKVSCERLLEMLTPDVLARLSDRKVPGGTAVLSKHEIELVRGTCEHVLDEEEINVDHGMNLIATVVALEPMLGLLGTVWGVLDAFAEMGSAGSANLATIAPSISAALVTTVVGLIVAIPGVMFQTILKSRSRIIVSDMEWFVDELMCHIGREFQRKGE